MIGGTEEILWHFVIGGRRDTLVFCDWWHTGDTQLFCDCWHTGDTQLFCDQWHTVDTQVFCDCSHTGDTQIFCDRWYRGYPGICDRWHTEDVFSYFVISGTEEELRFDVIGGTGPPSTFIFLTGTISTKYITCSLRKC